MGTASFLQTLSFYILIKKTIQQVLSVQLALFAIDKHFFAVQIHTENYREVCETLWEGQADRE